MPTSGQIKRSVQLFADYAGDLVNSDLNTFSDALNNFVNFCENDEVFSNIHVQLLNVKGVDFDNWYSALHQGGNMAGNCRLMFPADAEERMAIMYQILLRVSDGRLQFQRFLTQHFAIGTSNITAYIHAFNGAITQKLVRELGYRLQDLLARLPEGQSSSVPLQVIQIIHHATNVIQQNAVGNDITRVANQANSAELKSLFNQLRQEILNEINDEEKKREIDEIITTASDLALAEKPKIVSIKALFSVLPPVASVLSITASILKILGH